MSLPLEEGDLGDTTGQPSPVQAEDEVPPTTKDQGKHGPVVTHKEGEGALNVDGADSAAPSHRLLSSLPQK